MLFKTIAATIRSSPIWVLIIGIGAIFDLLFHYLSALSYKYLLDKALLPRDASALVVIVVTLLCIGLLNVIAGIASDYAKARLGAKLLFDYRLKLFRYMQLQSHRFYEHFRIGDLLARYTDDIPAIQTAVLQTLSSGLLSLLSVVVGLSILFTLEWKLTLLAIGGSILLFVPYRLLKSRSLALGEAYYAHLEKFTGLIDENVKAEKVIRAFDLRQSMLAKVEGNLRLMRTIGVHRSFVHTNLNRLPLLAISVLTAVILCYGSYLTFDGQLTIGSFIAFNSIFITVGQSMFGIAAVLPNFLTARTSIQRVEQVMEWQPDVDGQGILELPTVRQGIALHDVSFAYVPGEPVLQRLHLEIPVHGYTSIVGASGSGKSTVLKMLLRFEDPNSGVVMYDGMDIRDVRYASLLRQIGIVFQESILLNASIRDNLLVGKPDATAEEIEEAARAAGIHETIVGLAKGYDTIIHHQGDNLSGGQRQRLALARALLRKPNILFLDEATSALDPDAERAVNETIWSLSRSRAIISVTHRLAYAAMSDRIIVLDKGAVDDMGTHEELMARGGLYRKMWAKQQGFVLHRDSDSAMVETERLRTLPFFKGIEEDALQQISRLFVMETFAASVQVVEQGAQGDKLYLIARGKVEKVVGSEAGGRDKVAVLGDGDHFGEISFIYRIAQATSVVTKTSCILLSLSYEKFHPLLKQYPSIREGLEATLREHMQRRDTR